MSPSRAIEPRLIGRYTIFDEVASGGMAVVHVGRIAGAGGFARTVAIKRMHDNLAKDEQFVAMFLDEARLASRIRHPNVVSILDVVAMAGDMLLVMDYIEGESLARLLASSATRGLTLPDRILASILAGVLHGLHAAHEARDEGGRPLDIVHRDVSPQNILVGVDGVSRVVDFGIASAAARTTITAEGELKGKVAYMAPEQVTGGKTTRLSDIYASGVVLWECLAGRRMFASTNPAELIHRIMTEDIAPPSSVRAGVNDALEAIAMRALRKNPEERFRTAREMALAVERALPMAGSTDVGAWVEDVAAEHLARKANIVAAVEARWLAEGVAGDDGTRVERGGSPSEDPTRVGSGSAASTGQPSSGHIRAVRPSQTPTPLSTGKTLKPLTSGGTGPVAAVSETRLSSAATERRNRRILIIDDSESILAMARRVLSADGHDVIATAQVVGNARHIPSSDLIIVDFHMPGIDGAAVVQSMREAAVGHKVCPIYLYTSDAKVASEYWKYGFDGSLTEKGSEMALIQQVRAVFRRMDIRSLRKNAL